MDGLLSLANNRVVESAGVCWSVLEGAGGMDFME